MRKMNAYDKMEFKNEKRRDANAKGEKQRCKCKSGKADAYRRITTAREI